MNGIKNLSYGYKKRKTRWRSGSVVIYGLLCDFYRLRWALSFACQAFYAILFSCRVRFLLRSRVSRSIRPVKKSNGADLYADSVSSAGVPVNCNSGSMYALFRRWFNRSPDIVALMLTDYFAFLLEFRIYWQFNFT